MKATFTLLLTTFYFCAFCQTVKTTRTDFSVQVNEYTIVKDEKGERVSFPEVMRMVSSGRYTLDPVLEKRAEVMEYTIRPTRQQDIGKREVVMRTPGTENFLKPEPGTPLPDFVIYDTEGKPVRNADLKGKIVVINFWFTLCKPCLYEMPAINKLAAHYTKRNDVVFIAPTLEDRDQVLHFMTLQPFAYTACPNATSITDALKVETYPTHLVVGRDGKIFTSYAGGLPNTEDVLRNDIDAALKQ